MHSAEQIKIICVTVNRAFVFRTGNSGRRPWPNPEWHRLARSLISSDLLAAFGNTGIMLLITLGCSCQMYQFHLPHRLLSGQYKFPPPFFIFFLAVRRENYYDGKNRWRVQGGKSISELRSLEFQKVVFGIISSFYFLYSPRLDCFHILLITQVLLKFVDQMLLKFRLKNKNLVITNPPKFWSWTGMVKK